MDNWTEIKEGNITLKHHSTSSEIELIWEDAESTQGMFFDYYEFESLVKAIEKTKVNNEK
jgi:hypothetical protein